MANLIQTEGYEKRKRFQGRRRRFLRMHAWVSTLMLIAFLVLINLIALRFPLAWNVSLRRRDVSPFVKEVIRALDKPVEIDCVLSFDNPVKDAMRALLLDYQRVAAEAGTGPNLTVRFVDPRRDVHALHALRDVMETETEGIVLRRGDETRWIRIDSLLNRAMLLEDGQANWIWESFRGDAVVGAELARLVEGRSRILYNLQGHGEKDFNDYDSSEGYSDAARILRRLGYEIRPLRWTDAVKVPEDASAVIVAGPEQTLASSERDALRHFMERGGRLLVLLEPGKDAGLRPLLKEWGVLPLPAVAMGQTLTGQELVISDYGEHPVVAPLKNLLLVFTRATAFELTSESGGTRDRGVDSLDQPSVTALASTGDNGWISHDLDSFSPAFMPGRDRRGSFAVAVAVEKGGQKDLAHVPIARMIVLGDPDFASNRVLSSGTGANRDLLLGILSWLTEQRISVSAPEDYTLLVSMSPRRWRWLMAFCALGWPLTWVLAGGIVIRIRRRSVK